MITFDAYRALYYEARQYEDIDRYIMDRGRTAWMDGMDADRIADLLRNIYTISRSGISGMLEVDGTTLTDFSKRYGISYNTTMKWKRDETVPAEHAMLLLGYAILSNKTT